jgi:hypothetical protein
MIMASSTFIFNICLLVVMLTPETVYIALAFSLRMSCTFMP